MSVKTDYNYNDDDFVERDGKLQELTVTITLSEYRELIKAIERYDMANTRLQEEKEKLEAENKNLKDAITVCKAPEIFQKIGKAIGEAFAPTDDDEEDTEQEENN